MGATGTMTVTPGGSDRRCRDYLAPDSWHLSSGGLIGPQVPSYQWQLLLRNPHLEHLLLLDLGRRVLAQEHQHHRAADIEAFLCGDHTAALRVEEKRATRLRGLEVAADDLEWQRAGSAGA